MSFVQGGSTSTTPAGWVEELRFNGFIFRSDHPAVLEQTERFATELIPAVRDAVTGART